MTVNRWQGIIFDLDDVLYPERDFVLSGFREVATVAQSILAIEQEIGFKELKQLFESGVRGDTFNRWLQSHGVNDKEMLSKCISIYRNHRPILTPFPEIHPLMSKLRKNTKLGLLSDGYLEVQKRKLEALGIHKYFHAVVFSDEYGRNAWKPSRVPFDAILKKIDCAPHRCVYIGDNSSKDFLAPRLLHMGSVRVKREGGEYAAVEPPSPEFEADITIADLTQLESALDQLNNIRSN
jgi:putative hydrolase of the HAD superfamily